MAGEEGVPPEAKPKKIKVKREKTKKMIPIEVPLVKADDLQKNKALANI